MRHALKPFLPALAFLLALAGCSDRNNPVACTMEFRYVTIHVIGGDLTDHYTLRPATGDTLRYDDPGIPEEGYYVVLDDNFQPQMEGKQETFTFLGFIDDNEVVREEFVIRADVCHIEYVSGNTEVVL